MKCKKCVHDRDWGCAIGMIGPCDNFANKKQFRRQQRQEYVATEARHVTD